MEKELEQMKASMASRPDSLNTDKDSRSLTQTVGFEASCMGTVPTASTISPEEAMFQDPDWSFIAQGIDEIEIQPVVIAELLRRQVLHPC